MLIGRISVNVKLARRKKAQKCTSYTIVQVGTKSDEGFQMLSESGNKNTQ